jgi:hypothetical protein
MEKVNMAVIFSSLKCLDGVFHILCLVLGNLAPLVYTPLSYPTEDFLPWTEPHYNPYKDLIIYVMHEIQVVENENICKLMVDHFEWNEIEWNTNLSKTWEMSDYSCEVYAFGYFIFKWKNLLSIFKLFRLLFMICYDDLKV